MYGYVYNAEYLCKSTRGVLILCCHVQHMVWPVPIEPKMSSGGRRGAEKSNKSLRRNDLHVCALVSLPSKKTVSWRHGMVPRDQSGRAPKWASEGSQPPRSEPDRYRDSHRAVTAPIQVKIGVIYQ